jgi:flavin reductase (DIM6/NTAB) family NADH-FMN oxidoreductase RutF
MKRLLNPTAALLPIPCVLVVSGDMEHSNIMTVSLAALVNASPPMVGISVRQQTRSFGLILQFKEFTVNVPPQDILRETDACGMASGAEADKFEQTGLTKVSSSVVMPPIIEEAIISLECIVRQANELGSHTLFIGEIVQVHVDEKIIDDYERIDIDRALPFVYCPLVHEYRAIGRKLGKYGFTRETNEAGDDK